MLFRRFIILTVLIAFTAIICINIVQATTAPQRDFAVGDRLKQWEALERKSEEVCPPADRVCENEHALVRLA